MSGHVYISYSRTDSYYVDRLVAFLGQAGIPTWTDHDVDFAALWPSIVETRLRNASAFLSVQSPAWAESSWQQREAEQARKLGIPVLTLMLDGQPPTRLGGSSFEDVRGDAMPSAGFVQTLRSAVGMSQTTITAPARADVWNAALVGAPLAGEARTSGESSLTRSGGTIAAAVSGALAALIIVAVALTVTLVNLRGDKSTPVAANPTVAAPGPTQGSSGGGSGPCEWISDYPAGSELPQGMKDVGLPPANPPRTGKQVLVFETNLGVIKVEMDLAKTPCTAASLSHLAGAKYYDNTSCHRLVKEIFVLQCGDPTGQGYGGPSYRYADENLPTAYHSGDVAMANTGEPGSNGGQFFFVYDDNQLPGAYTLFGKVIEGMDIIKDVAAAGDDGAYAAQAGGGHPNKQIILKSVHAEPASA